MEILEVADRDDESLPEVEVGGVRTQLVEAASDARRLAEHVERPGIGVEPAVLAGCECRPLQPE